MNKIFTVFFTFYLIACVAVSTSIFTNFVIAAIDNKALGYFDGEFFQYNPVIHKQALLIKERRPAELDMSCHGQVADHGSGKKFYSIVLYANNATNVSFPPVVSNDEYRGIYGMDHPCHKE